MTGFTRATVARVVERDRGTCVRCGRPVDLSARGIAWSVHHRRPRGMGGSRNPAVSAASNALTLCGSGTTGCHGAVESDRDAARRQGYLVPQWRDPVDVPVLHRVHGWCWVGDTAWVPLSQGELWIQAGEWLADEARLRAIDPSEDEFMTLSRAAAELYGLKAKEAA
ncbi:HNH endonuclease [Cellulomonas sp. C5510]|uniref:HNH endonuclease n=1 Tax=Cellulomonas sp. C5510 TaxID=2871170 RepID=UPI001C93B93B|nr:hypothetical protein [Cellulomonas sp. C5510]QZN86929.1 hypothetical protein K5O09_07405 [Cellulomonas sp. C5510]